MSVPVPEDCVTTSGKAGGAVEHSIKTAAQDGSAHDQVLVLPSGIRAALAFFLNVCFQFSSDKAFSI